MSKLLEKSINVGAGLFSYSREKIENLVDELVKRGDVARKDASSFVDDLVKKGEEQKIEFRKIIREEIEKTLDITTLAKKEDIREIIREELNRTIRDEDIVKKADTSDQASKHNKK